MGHSAKAKTLNVDVAYHHDFTGPTQLENTCHFRPLLDRVLVRPDKAPERIGLIHLPDEAQDGLKIRQRVGTVVAVGPGRRNKQGNVQPCDLKPGDRVQIEMYADSELGPEGRACMPLVIDGEEFLLMNESDIAAKYA